ncbi:MAG: two-component regulator propeller domain-containing protein [Flavobacteriaceae bacterium]
MNQQLYILLILLFFVKGLFSQTTDNDAWEGHFSYTKIKAVVDGGDKIYAASENAIFSYDPITEERETITTINGLSGEYITTMHYSTDYDLLIIGYQSGLLEIYSPTTKTVLKVVDILNKTSIPPENKQINHFFENESSVYISTNYGISVYDLEALEFGDTYYIGANGSQIQINQTFINGNLIYAATNTGLKTADINSSNLIDFQTWNTLFLGNFIAVNRVQGVIYTVKSDNTLLQIIGTTITLVLNFSNDVLELKNNAENLLVVTTVDVQRYDTNLTLLENYTLPDEFNTTITSGLFKTNTMFIGTENEGLLKTSISFPNDFLAVHPDGPLQNTPFSLQYGYGHLWVTFGDYDVYFNPSPFRKLGFSYYENETWTSISYDSIQQSIQKPVFNLNDIEINPVNSNEVFISSFHHGLLNFQKNYSIELLDETNSGLQSLVLAGAPNYKSIRVSDTEFDNQGYLWTLTSLLEEPLKRFNPATNQWQSFSFSAIINDPINDELGFEEFTIGPDGTKWVASFKNGVIGFNETGNLIKQIVGEDTANLPSNYIRALALDKNNVLWIGTFKGLRILYNTSNFFAEETTQTEPIIILEDGLPKELLELQFITDIIVDGSNNKWISTVDAGVFYLSSDGQKTIYHFTKDNSPLPSNNVNTMAQNKDNGTIYFGTTRGLVSFKAGGSSPSNSLEDTFVYPNPVRPGFNLGIDKVKIKNLSESVNIKITDVEGNLVAEAESNTNLRFKGYNLEIDGGTAYWNGKNLANKTVASGVYVVMISDLDNLETRVLKIMLIRQ